MRAEPPPQAARPIVLAGEVRAFARSPETADHHEGEFRLHRAPRDLSRLRRRQDIRRDRQCHGRAALHRPVDLVRVQPQPARDPGAAPQGAERHRPLRPEAIEPRPQGASCTRSRRSRATSCSRRRSSDLVRIVRGIVNLYERAQVRLFVRRDAFRRFYSCLVFVPRDRYNTQVARTHRASSRCEAFGGPGDRVAGDALGVRARAAAHAGAHAAGGEPRRSMRPCSSGRSWKRVRTWQDHLQGRAARVARRGGVVAPVA